MPKNDHSAETKSSKEIPVTGGLSQEILNIQKKWAFTPPFAGEKGQISVGLSEFLKENGFPLEIEQFDNLNDEGWTPLTFAIYAGNAFAAIELIKFYADLNKPNLQGKYPLELTLEKLTEDPGFRGVYNALVDAGAKTKTGSIAAPGSLWNQVEEMLKKEIKKGQENTHLTQKNVDAMEVALYTDVVRFSLKPSEQNKQQTQRSASDQLESKQEAEAKTIKEFYFANTDEINKIRTIYYYREHRIKLLKDSEKVTVHDLIPFKDRTENESHWINILEKIRIGKPLESKEEENLLQKIRVRQLPEFLRKSEEEKNLVEFEKIMTLPLNENVSESVMLWLLKKLENEHAELEPQTFSFVLNVLCKKDATKFLDFVMASDLNEIAFKKIVLYVSKNIGKSEFKIDEQQFSIWLKTISGLGTEKQERSLKLIEMVLENDQVTKDSKVVSSIIGLLGILPDSSHKLIVEKIREKIQLPGDTSDIKLSLLNHLIRQEDFYALERLLANKDYQERFLSIDFSQYSDSPIEIPSKLIALFIKIHETNSLYGDQTHLFKMIQGLDLEYIQTKRTVYWGGTLAAPDLIEYFTRKENYDSVLFEKLLKKHEIVLSYNEKEVLSLFQKLIEEPQKRDPRSIITCLKSFKIKPTPEITKILLFDIYPMLLRDKTSVTYCQDFLQYMSEAFNVQNDNNISFVELQLEQPNPIFLDFLKQYTGPKAKEYLYFSFCRLARIDLSRKEDTDHVHEIYQLLVKHDKSFFSKILKEKSPLVKPLMEAFEWAIKNEQPYFIIWALKTIFTPENQTYVYAFIELAKRHRKHNIHQILIDSLKIEVQPVEAQPVEVQPVKGAELESGDDNIIDVLKIKQMSLDTTDEKDRKEIEEIEESKEQKEHHEVFSSHREESSVVPPSAESKRGSESLNLEVKQRKESEDTQSLMPTDFNWEIDLQLFTQLQNDHQIAGTQYEGNTLLKTSSYQINMVDYALEHQSQPYFSLYQSLMPKMLKVKNELNLFQKALTQIDECIDTGYLNGCITNDGRMVNENEFYKRYTATTPKDYYGRYPGYEAALEKAKHEYRLKVRKDFAFEISGLLKGQDSIVLPTGWQGKREGEGSIHGHAALIKIEKTGSVYRIMVLNTGSGLEKHKRKLVKNKIKYCPVRILEGVSEAMLTNIIEDLVLKPRTNPKWFSSDVNSKEKIEYNADVLYSEWDKYEKYEVDPLQIYPYYITPQRGGTCASKVFSPYYRGVFKEDFKLSKLLRKELVNLHFLFEVEHNKINPTVETIRQLEYSLENFARFLKKLKKSKVSPELLEVSQDRLSENLKQLAKIKDIVSKKREEEARSLVVPTIETVLDEGVKTTINERVDTVVTEVKTNAEEIQSIPINEFEFKEISEKTIANFIAFCEQYYKNGQFQEAKTLIENFVLKWNIPFDGMDNLRNNKKVVTEFLTGLNTLYGMYNEVSQVQTKGEITSETLIVNMALRLNAMQLLDQCMPDMSRDFDVIKSAKRELESMNTQLSSMYFNCYHPKWLPHINKLKPLTITLLEKGKTYSSCPLYDYIVKYYPNLAQIGKILAEEQRRLHLEQYPNDNYRLPCGPGEYLNQITSLMGNVDYLKQHAILNAVQHKDALMKAETELLNFADDQDLVAHHNNQFKNAAAYFARPLNSLYPNIDASVVKYFFREKNCYENLNQIQKLFFPVSFSTLEKDLTRRLLHIRSSKENQIFSMIDFFKNNPTLFHQSSNDGSTDVGKDFQLIFHVSLFEPGALKIECEKNKHLPNQILEFISWGLKEYRDEHCLLPAGAFLYEQAILLSEYFPTNTAINNLDRDLEFFRKNESIISSLPDKRLTYGRLCKVKAYQLLKELEMDSSKFTTEKVIDFLKLYAKSNQLSGLTPILNDSTKLLEIKISEQFQKIRMQLQKHLKEPAVLNSIVTGILTDLSPESLETFGKEHSELINQFPILILKNTVSHAMIRINLETGVIYLKGQMKKSNLPTEIRKSAFFQDHFGNIDPVGLISPSEGLFEFEKDGSTYRLVYRIIAGRKMTDDNPKVQLKTIIDGKEVWCKQLQPILTYQGEFDMTGVAGLPKTISYDSSLYAGNDSAFWISRNTGKIKVKSSVSYLHLVTVEQMPEFGLLRPGGLKQWSAYCNQLISIPGVHTVIKCGDDYYVRNRQQSGFNFWKEPPYIKVTEKFGEYFKTLPFNEKESHESKIEFGSVEKDNLKKLLEMLGTNESTVYEVDDNQQITGYQLRSVPFKPTKPLDKLLAQIERNDYIEIFDNTEPKGAPLKINLPRYQLKFISERYEGDWQLFLDNQKDKPRVRLITNQPKPELIPSFNHWLLAEDINTKVQYAILPKQTFIGPRSKDEDKIKADMPAFNLDGNRFKKNDKRFLATWRERLLDPDFLLENSEQAIKVKIENGQLVPSSGEDLLYLAYVNLYSQNPTTAYSLLTSGQKNAPLLGTDAEKTWLHHLIMHHDDKESRRFFKQAGYVSVQLQATYLMIKNHFIKNPSILLDYNNSPEFSKTITEAYSAYLDTLNNTPVDLRLPPDVEFTILNYLENNPSVNKKQLPKNLVSRYQQLKGHALLKERQILISTLKTPKSAQRVKEIDELLQNGVITCPYSFDLGEPIDPKLIPELDGIEANIGNNMKKMLKTPFSMVANFKRLCGFAAIKESFEQYLPDEVASIQARQKKEVMDRVYQEFETLRLKLIEAEGDATKKLTPFEKLNFEMFKILILISEDPDKFLGFLELIHKSEDVKKVIQTLNLYNSLLASSETVTVNLPITPKIVEAEWNTQEYKPLVLRPEPFESELKSDLVTHYNLPADLKTPITLSQYNDKSFVEKLSEHMRADYLKGKERNAEELRFRHFCTHTFKTHFKNNVQLLQKNLNHDIQTLQVEAENLKKELEALANDKYQSRENELALVGKENKRLTINDLLGLFLSNNPKLYAVETGLSDAQIKILHQKISHWLIKSIKLQKLTRADKCMKQLKDHDEKTAVYDNLLENLGSELYSKWDNVDHYIKQPAHLVFEYLENKMLRPNQVNMIDALLVQENGLYKDKIIQLMMGGGKTKVLSPLALKHKANGDNLCIIHVPPALFETNLIDLQLMSRKLFGQEAVPFQFERNNPCTEQYLELLYKNLETCMLQKNYIVTTGNAMRSLKLKYYDILEEINKNPKDLDLWKQFKVLQKIINLFKTKGDCLIDEVDSSLNIQQELNYPSGAEQALDSQDNEGLTELYSSLTNFLGVKRHDEFVKIYSEKSESYIKDKLRSLPEYLIYRFPQNNPAIFNIIKNMTAEEKNNIVLYLQNSKKADFDAIRSLPKSDRNILAIYKHQINSLLPISLSKRPNENYGFSKILPYPHNEIPIPYYASQKPKEGSQFANLYTASNYAVQMQYFNGISLDSFKKIIQHFREKALLEYNTFRTRDMISLSNTKAAKEFAMLTGIEVPLNDIPLTDNTLIAKLFNDKIAKKPEVIKFVCQHYILPNIKMHKKMLSMNAVQEVGLYRSAQGISGTVWNWRSFNEKLDLDEKQSLGTDGQTIDTLLNKSVNIFSESGLTLDGILKKYFSSLKDPSNVHALIDIGALFKDYTNETVVTTIINQIKQIKDSRCKYILYYDDNNFLCARSIFDNSIIPIGSSDHDVIKQKLGCDESEWFTYYDQAHTTGTDIKQALEARALVTFSKDSLLRDLLQGIMRLRQFSQGQNIDLLIPEDLYVLFDGKPTVEKIIELGILNQETLVKKHHYISTIAKLHRLFQDNLDQHLNRISDPKIKLQFYNVCNRFFIKAQELDPFMELGEMERDDLNPLDILKQFQKYYINDWEKVIIEAKSLITIDPEGVLKKQLEEESLKIIESIKEHLPEKVTQKEHSNVTATQEASKQTVATQDVKQVKESEKQMQQTVVSRRPGEDVRLTPDQRTPWTSSEFQKWVMSSNDGFEEKEVKDKLEAESLDDKESKENPESTELARYQASCPKRLLSVIVNGSSIDFSSNLYVSRDYQNTFRQNAIVEGLMKKPVQYVLMKQNESGLHAMIINAKEAAELQAFVENGKPEKGDTSVIPNVWIQTVGGEVYAGQKPEKLTAEYRTIEEQLHFYSGDLEYLSQNLDQNRWFTKERIRPLLRYYMENILQDEPLNNSTFAFVQKKLLQSAPSQDTELDSSGKFVGWGLQQATGSEGSQKRKYPRFHQQLDTTPKAPKGPSSPKKVG